jgi:hypothetical protein
MFIILAGAVVGFYLYGFYGLILGILVALGVVWKWDIQKRTGSS